MTLYELVASGFGVMFLLMSLIQIAPIKVDPWTALGNAMMRDIYLKIDNVEAKVDDLSATTAKQAAENYRTQILRFGDDLIQGKKHTKEHFDTILDAITSYKEYCDGHPYFKNERTVLITQHIKRIYTECLEKHSFLKEE